MPLPFVPLDTTNERQHRTLIATTINELIRACYPREGDWTAAIRGSGTAGTYQIASQTCRYTRIGRRVWLDVGITMAAVVTGGGTTALQITGAPYAKAASTFPVGSVRLNGLDTSAGAVHASLVFSATSASSILMISETQDNAAPTDFAISGIAANDTIHASICYETDDP